jgi:hypothetical protein
MGRQKIKLLNAKSTVGRNQELVLAVPKLYVYPVGLPVSKLNPVIVFSSNCHASLYCCSREFSGRTRIATWMRSDIFYKFRWNLQENVKSNKMHEQLEDPLTVAPKNTDFSNAERAFFGAQTGAKRETGETRVLPRHVSIRLP